jgi:hypothetical protein
LATTNLVPASWQSIASNVADPNGVIRFNDAETNAVQRFYRIRGLQARLCGYQETKMIGWGMDSVWGRLRLFDW